MHGIISTLPEGISICAQQECGLFMCQGCSIIGSRRLPPALPEPVFTSESVDWLQPSAGYGYMALAGERLRIAGKRQNLELGVDRLQGLGKSEPVPNVFPSGNSQIFLKILAGYWSL
jgi:hypothetical protein